MTDDLARARTEACEARSIADMLPEDRMAQHRAYAAERKLAEVRETCRRQRDERRDHREREIDARIHAVVAQAMDGLLDDLTNKFAVPLGELMQRELGALERKLADVEAMLRTVRKPPDSSAPIPLRDRRVAN
jgi:hypothetical protein